MNSPGDDDASATTLGALLEEIAFRRRRDARRTGGGAAGALGGARHLQQSTTYWTDLFVRHFLFTPDPIEGNGARDDHDDLLFFIRRCGDGAACPTLASAAATAMRNETFSVEVFRRDSRKLPIGDPDVDWEETVYLNMIIHHLDYTLTLAVCSRTSPKNLQVLRRYSQKVYATPSRRKMQESKADAEEMTYPYLSFNVDDYEDRFSEVVVRDGESVGVELTASDPGGAHGLRAVLFSASVPYEAVHRVYETRASLTVRKRLSQTNLFSLFGGKSYGEARIEFVRLTGPQGHAELAISRVKDHYGNYSNGGCDTPSSEPATDILDLYDSDLEGDGDGDYGRGNVPNTIGGSSRGKANMVQGHRMGRTHQRRLSDPSSALGDFIRVGVGAAQRASGGGARATNFTTNSAYPPQPPSGPDGAFDVGGDATCEIYAGDLLDEFEEAKYHPLWAMPGYTQIFHFWRESRRVQSVPLGQFVTYVNLPWWSILKDILDKRTQPLLTF